MPSTYNPIKPRDTAIVLIDHQPGVVQMVKSIPVEEMAANVAVLGRLGEAGLGIPLLVTSTRESLEFLGTNIEEIQESAPQAYQRRIRRDGTLNAFADPAFTSAVKDLNRPNLVIAGILTDVCLWHSAVSGVQEGYKVHVVADASGTTSALADEVTYARMRELGIEVTSTYGVLFELYPDLSTPDGQRAEAAAVGAPVAA